MMEEIKLIILKLNEIKSIEHFLTNVKFKKYYIKY